MKREPAWIKGEIRTVQGNRHRARRAVCRHKARHTSGCGMNAIIQAPIEVVRERRGGRRVGAAEPGEDHVAHIRDAVRLAVHQEEEIGACGDKDAAAVAGNRGWQTQVVRENRARMELTFALGVFQQPDAAGMRVRPGAAGIIGPFDDKQAAMLVKRHRDRRADHRLGGNQFEAPAGLDPETRRGIGSWSVERGAWSVRSRARFG